MNKENAKDYLPLVQAMAEGKVIQHAGTNWQWSDSLGEVTFYDSPNYYRIKPEPREIWVGRHIDGRNSSIAYESKIDADEAVDNIDWRSICYREVIE